MSDIANDHVRFLKLLRTQYRTVPNLLTAIRAMSSLWVFYLLVVHSDWAAGVYLITASTDWVDGWWARRYNQETFLGKMMDPIVDKLLITLAGIGVCVSHPVPWVLIPVGVILAREATVFALVETYRRKSLMLSVTWQGKVKTAAQVAALWLMMLNLSGDSAQVSRYVLVIAVTLTVESGVDYLLRARILSRPIPELE